MEQINRMQGRIFRNTFLESLTKSHPVFTPLFYLFMAAGFLLLSIKFTAHGFYNTLSIYVGGLFCWTLLEYILHRYIFHIDEYFASLKRFHYIIHGVHHEHPRDHQRLFMPPVPGTIIAGLLFLFWYLLLGSAAFAFMGGITSGYLMYAYIHYSVHTKPVFPPFKRLWKHHALHHYKYHDKAYGVSSPLWDIIFGTMPPGR